MYARETRRHIQTALKLGATIEEIMEVLKMCVAQGIEACNLGVPILADELERVEQKKKSSRIGETKAPYCTGTWGSRPLPYEDCRIKFQRSINRART